MNREIKLKAWFKDVSIMLEAATMYPDGMLGMSPYDFESYFEDSPFYENAGDICKNGTVDVVATYMEGDDWIFIEPEKLVWLEYTGMKDRNEVEIWEGDIMDVYSNGKFYRRVKVIYDVEWIMWKVLVINPETFIDLGWLTHLRSGVMEGYRQLEVVGNIYENPELLKQLEKNP